MNAPLLRAVLLAGLGSFVAGTTLASPNPPPPRTGYPSWWTNRSVVVSAALTNDYAPANLGQLKWFARQACVELDGHFPGGAGSNAWGMVLAFSTTNNHRPVNLGQIKVVSSALYARLIAEGYTNAPPWTTNSVADDRDYSPANLGQLKLVFSFDVTRSDDGDGMPDWWERHYFGHTNYNDSGDADGDGLPNLDEYLHATDPTRVDTDGDGMPDGWEVRYGLNPLVNDADGGTDGDGVSNLVEYLQGSDPTVGRCPDTNGLVALRVYTHLE